MKNKIKYINLVMLILFAVMFMFPILLTVVNSFSFDETGDIGLFPKNLTLKQYYELLIENYRYLGFFWNSIFYSVGITVLSIVISFPIAFCFAKLKFLFCDTIFFLYILIMMLPFQATLLPTYIGLSDFSLLDTPWALVLPMIFSPYAVFLLRQFMRKIPNELIEYTKLETSSAFNIFRYAVIPEIKPAIMALAILIFAESFNMVEQPLIFITNREIMPLSVMLNVLPQNVSFAGSTIYLIPMVVLFSFFKDTIETSLENLKWS